ncbi:MAG: DUF1573 domain-containing protein [Ferruginibacter sp.]
MFKIFFLAITISSMLVSCDVRKKDKMGMTAKQEIKDPTTVKIIDSLYNFGKTKEGEIVQYSYRFKNTGDKPLIVSDVHASCGCTIPEKPEQPIMPGETGFIRIKFDSNHRPGEVHKTISVASNANPPFTDLVLRGTVIGKDQEDKDSAKAN